MTSPEAVAGYQVSNRGPRSGSRVRRGTTIPLRVSRGSANGLVFHVAHDGSESESPVKDREVLVSGWSSAYVRSSVKAKDSHRYWELAPSTQEADVTLEQFGVWGRFQVVRSLRGREALEAWKARPR